MESKVIFVDFKKRQSVEAPVTPINKAEGDKVVESVRSKRILRTAESIAELQIACLRFKSLQVLSELEAEVEELKSGLDEYELKEVSRRATEIRDERILNEGLRTE